MTLKSKTAIVPELSKVIQRTLGGQKASFGRVITHIRKAVSTVWAGLRR